MKVNILLALVVLVNTFDGLAGHGYLKDPVNRASRWRVDSSAPTNYDDNGLNCGGYSTQWSTYAGRCGWCGDSYGNAQPRLHEIGGKIGGSGVIVKSYTKGSAINVVAKITANHRGYFSFRICNLDKQVESDNCFSEYKVYTTAGAENYTLPSASAGEFSLDLQLPSSLKCSHCVLQWTYTAGNNWGYCSDGSGKLGCGPQETFRTCSDIKIV